MKFDRAIAFAACLLAAAPAAAASYPSNNAVNFQRALKTGGYAVTTDKDNDGEAKLKVAVDGINYDIYFYECTRERDCLSYQIVAGYDLKTPTTASKMNEWNREKRLARAYIDDEGDPFIAADISMNAPDGASDALILANMRWFVSLSKDFHKFIDW